MENNEYNSLTEKLIQSGILQSNDEENNSANFFNTKNSHTQNPKEENKSAQPPVSRKRINNYDLELLNEADVKIDFENKSNLQKILYKFFPKLYEFKVAKDAIQKMTELGIDTNRLLDKTVPYGENELRYKNLVKFIQYANEIQTRLKRKN